MFKQTESQEVTAQENFDPHIFFSTGKFFEVELGAVTIRMDILLIKTNLQTSNHGTTLQTSSLAEQPSSQILNQLSK